MNKYDMEYIVIRHLFGSKANRIEHISVNPKSNTAFDTSPRDIVSRRRAVIRGIGNDQISFRH